MIRPLQVYWSSRQSRMAVIGEVEGEIKVLTFKINDVGRTMKHVTWKRIPHGWTLWKDVKR